MTVDFDALYRSHYRRVLGLCLKLLGKQSDAQDAAQEVFMRAFRAIDGYDASQPFGPWVLTIASRHCVDLLRRRSREPTAFAEADDAIAALESPAPEAPEIIAAAERDEALAAAIGALPDKYRAPLVLAYFNGMSYDEIAAMLDVTRNHVGVLLLRAKRALRQSLAETPAETLR